MEKAMGKLVQTTLAFLFILTTTGACVKFAQNAPIAKAGTLDLREWNFLKKGIVPLNGEWEFYWKELRGPSDFKTGAAAPAFYFAFPGPWNGKTLAAKEGRKLELTAHGYATYRLKTNVAYARFVPAEFLEMLGRESIIEVRRGDQIEKEMTILFSDIRSFTDLSEKMTPAATFAFINDYLERMAPLVHSNGGIIDKYIGDAIMALYPTGASAAIQSAVDMQRELRRYNESKQNGLIRAGIGIHSGRLMLGMIGDERRMDGTVISDAVNLASRLEGLTKLYRTDILASGATIAASGAKFQTRLLGLVQVKGKLGAVAVHEVLDGEPDRVREGKLANSSDFQAGLERYQAGRFKEASELFRRALAIFADDAAAALYLERSEHLLAHGAPAGWDGIERREAK